MAISVAAVLCRAVLEDAAREPATALGPVPLAVGELATIVAVGFAAELAAWMLPPQPVTDVAASRQATTQGLRVRRIVLLKVPGVS